MADVELTQELLALLEEDFLEDQDEGQQASQQQANLSKNLSLDQTLRLINDDEDIFEMATQRGDNSSPSSSPTRGRVSTSKSRKPLVEPSVKELFGDLSSDDEDLTEAGRDIRRELKKNNKEGKGFSLGSCRTKTQKQVWKSRPNGGETRAEPSAGHFDPFSGIRIINPLISSYEMKQRMKDKRKVRLTQIRKHINPKEMDIDGDWVTTGVITSKMSQNSKSNGNVYSILRLSDFQDMEKYVSVFLFGESHQTHWKLPVGTVVGLLNPVIMDRKNKDKNKASANEICSLKLDNSLKMLTIGTAKDFGHCKGLKKNGETCNSVIDKSTSLFCTYHIKIDYKKVTLRRPELKATYSGIEPNNSRSEVEQEKPYESTFSLALLGPDGGKRSDLIKKLNQEKKEEEETEKEKRRRKVTEAVVEKTPLEKEKTRVLVEERNIRRELEAEMIAKAISVPITVAARTFAAATNGVTDFTVKSDKKATSFCVSDFQSPQDLFNQLKPSPSIMAMNAKVPKLGKGFCEGQVIDLNKKWDPRRRALVMLKKKPIVREDPNDPKLKRKLALEAIMKKVDHNLETEEMRERGRGGGSQLKRKASDNRLEKDTDSEKKRKREQLQAFISRRSAHDHEVEQLERKEEDRYFNLLEKREHVEEKMKAVTELEVNVVLCKECKYIAQGQSEYCKTQGHPVTRAKATKRWFKCQKCSHRSHTFNAFLPTKPCSRCGDNHFEKTSMKALREGPKLPNEKLLIRGEEVKFLNK